MSPFPIEAASILRVEADTEEGILIGGVTRIISADVPPAIDESKPN
jgi:hypothetical protein